ncbi:PREDICTED: uncharacterized protein C11orf24 homolog [Amphimedon queenslandica]|uniref:MANSC domain-containing protein n=1 Tax=Amphimedon queenslandica TaxID=400682 RepID=A0A1X7UN28_AMPQE|nr:PREDICTED: uncharacterized protein C11orf24 homolog [Amphimedon queenslandica]|eukprot:XP_003387224.1 PREDICTED: uncharacterized protein C11orf24 homolog [Amphimedon queenslandica]
MKSLAGIILIFLTVSLAIAGHVYEDDTICSASGRHHRSYDGRIVDIKKSRELGARLLAGSSASSYPDCLESCCYDDSCDMALFRSQDTYNSDGSTKHNCYLIQCKEKSNCIMAHHSQFTATYFEKNEEQPVIPEKATTKVESTSTLYSLPARTQSKSVSRASVTITRVRPTPSSSSTSSSAVIHRSSVIPSPGAMLTNPPSTTQTSIDGVMQPSPAPSVTTGSSTIDGTVETGSPNEQPHNAVDGNEEEHLPACAGSDCGSSSGSGLIIGLVMGSAFFLLVVLTVAAVIHRLHSNRKKKHYHNVDYLINGMYS